MGLKLALALLTASGDPLAESARRLAPILPGLSDRLIVREETQSWLSAGRYAGRLILPGAVYAAARTDAERDAATILTAVYARNDPMPLLSPSGNVLLELVGATLSAVAEAEIEQGTLPQTFGDIPMRATPLPRKRALTLAIRHGIGVCPMVTLLHRLGTPGPDGQLTAIALDARRMRRDLGLAAHGC